MSGVLYCGPCCGEPSEKRGKVHRICTFSEEDDVVRPCHTSWEGSLIPRSCHFWTGHLQVSDKYMNCVAPITQICHVTLAPKMLAKASQNEAQINNKCIRFSSSFSCRVCFCFATFFWHDPRFDFYLEYFRRVRHFFQSREAYQKWRSKWLPKCSQEPSKIH